MKRLYFHLVSLLLLFSSISYSQDFPTKGDIYNYEVGDEFHKIQIYKYGEYSEWYFTDSTIRIIEVVDKIISDNNDTITYEFFVRELDIFESDPQISYYEYTTTEVMTDLATIFVGDTAFENGELYNGRTIVKTEDEYMEGAQERYYEWNWVVGCGLTYYYNYNFNWASIAADLYTQNLIYFKKGEEEWGEAQTIVGFNELNQKKALQVFPNPASDYIYISTKEDSEIHIFNSTGQLILIQKSQAENTQVDISTFPTGIYFVNLTNEDGLNVGKSKFLKL